MMNERFSKNKEEWLERERKDRIWRLGRAMVQTIELVTLGANPCSEKQCNYISALDYEQRSEMIVGCTICRKQVQAPSLDEAIQKWNKLNPIKLPKVFEE